MNDQFYMWALPNYFLHQKANQKFNFFSLTEELFLYLNEWSAILTPLTFINCCDSISKELEKIQNDSWSQVEKYGVKVLVQLAKSVVEEKEETFSKIKQNIQKLLFKIQCELSFLLRNDSGQAQEIVHIFQLFLSSNILSKPPNLDRFRQVLANTDYYSLFQKMNKNRKREEKSSNDEQLRSEQKQKWVKHLRVKRKNRNIEKKKQKSERLESKDVLDGERVGKKGKKFFQTKINIKQKKIAHVGIFIPKSTSYEESFNTVREKREVPSMKQKVWKKKEILEKIKVDDEEMIVLVPGTP